jgi:hypothetical protein
MDCKNKTGTHGISCLGKTTRPGRRSWRRPDRNWSAAAGLPAIPTQERVTARNTSGVVGSVAVFYVAQDCSRISGQTQPSTPNTARLDAVRPRSRRGPTSTGCRRNCFGRLASTLAPITPRCRRLTSRLDRAEHPADLGRTQVSRVAVSLHGQNSMGALLESATIVASARIIFAQSQA